jgi:hypothetical protein
LNTKLQQGLFWIGVIFCLVGIFLPWEIQGDPILLYTYGIQLFPRMADHGGFEFLLLTVYLVYGTLMSPPPPQKAGLGYLMSAVLLVLSALYFSGRWFLHNILYTGVTGAPVLGIGLILILVGSVMLVTIAMTKI